MSQTITTSIMQTKIKTHAIRHFKNIFKTISNIFQLFGVICMACAAPAIGITFNRLQDPFGIGHNHWFLFVVVTCFIITLLWTFFYLLQIRDFIKVKLPFTFLKVELIFTLVATVLYTIAFIVILAGYSWCSSSQKLGGSRECDARVAGGVSGFSRLERLLASF